APLSGEPRDASKGRGPRDARSQGWLDIARTVGRSRRPRDQRPRRRREGGAAHSRDARCAALRGRRHSPRVGRAPLRGRGSRDRREHPRRAKGDGAVGDFTHPFPDPTRADYTYRLRAETNDGERYAGPLVTSGADDLFLELPDPPWE